MTETPAFKPSIRFQESDPEDDTFCHVCGDQIVGKVHRVTARIGAFDFTSKIAVDTACRDLLEWPE